MAVHLLEGAFFGARNAQELIGQRERLLALGSLSAGLTHELNNPAAAAVRATESLRERVAGMRQKLGMLMKKPYHKPVLEALMELQDRAVEQVAKAPSLSPMEASDAEDAVGDWLDGYGIPGAWDIAPTLVQAGLGTAWLDRVAEAADVHELLDSTLVMLAGKIGPGITVVKDYDRALPRIPAYPAELNQVWTNLIDNAVTAMDGNGTLTVRTALDRDHVLVEFGDTGPGIPPEITDRIFEPFFTTKPVGEGTGLGLDISWRIIVGKHHGDLTVESAPGDT